MKRLCSFILALVMTMTITYAVDKESKPYVRNDEMIEMICESINYDYNQMGGNCFIQEYYNVFDRGADTDRISTLISVMRLYNLIPDPDIYSCAYTWDDTPEKITDQELAYVNFAKYLGITNGTSETIFGFNDKITYWQVDTFIERTKSVSNKYQYQYNFTFVDDSELNYGIFCKPLIAEYLYKLPDNVADNFTDGNWTFQILCGNIPKVTTDAVGATYYYQKKITIVANTHGLNVSSFTDTLIHEIGHGIDAELNQGMSYEVTSEILETEMPKLAKNYRIYASTDKYEYMACAWRYMDIIGEEKFKVEYPLTYDIFVDILSKF